MIEWMNAMAEVNADEELQQCIEQLTALKFRYEKLNESTCVKIKNAIADLTI